MQMPLYLSDLYARMFLNIQNYLTGRFILRLMLLAIILLALIVLWNGYPHLTNALMHINSHNSHQLATVIINGDDPWPPRP